MEVDESLQVLQAEDDEEDEQSTTGSQTSDPSELSLVSGAAAGSYRSDTEMGLRGEG